MSQHLAPLPLLLLVGAAWSSTPASAPPCSDAWNQMVESTVASDDGRGHGPDVGSDEWKSVIEFRLGVRGRPEVPSRESPAWCAYVDRLARERAAAKGKGRPAAPSPASGPSFACDKVSPGSIEGTVCEDKSLSALDRKLSDVFAAAAKKATNERPPRLKAEQRGWIKGRDECWKSADMRGCVQDEYLRRIAELEARYALVPGTGPFFYACDGNPANEVVVTYYPTEPPTLIAERGDSVSLMFLQPGGSSAQYQGRNESLRERQGEAVVTWGDGAPEMRCKRK